MRDFGSLQDDLNKNAADFLRIDLDTALTLARIASEAPEGSERRSRNIRNARVAYETVSRFRTKTETNPEEDEEIKEKVSRLRTALERLGESFD